METLKNFKTLTIALVLFAVILSAYAKTNLADMAKNDKPGSEQLSDEQSLRGNSEFYLKPAGDERLWHVINTYTDDKSQSYNNSTYLFSSDSVLVINNYLVDADNEKLNLALVGINTKQIKN